MKPVDVIEVLIWGKRVGATTADPALGCYAFEYEPAWKRRDIELAPLTMPLSDRRQTFTFPALPKLTFFGLPSMLADALPDDFGNALIDAWMATKGIEKSAVTVLDRLAYMGKSSTRTLFSFPIQYSHGSKRQGRKNANDHVKT
jgi:serine/threonine-protein kinase HipA